MYDLADRMTSRVFTNLAGTKISAWESIGYDANDNPTAETVLQKPPGTAAARTGGATLGYDSLDRLSSFKHPFESSTATYGLDDAGNVTSEPGATFTFTNNRVTRRTISLTEYYDYGYDPFGNATTETKQVLLQPAATTTTSYDAASHTRRVTSPDGSWVEYAYDGLDRMVSRHDSTGAAVLLFHDGLSDQISVETSTAGAVATRYLVDSSGTPRGKLDIGNSTGRSYYITDPRGNVTQMVRYTDHAIMAVFNYDPYGKDKTALTNRTGNWDSRL